MEKKECRRCLVYKIATAEFFYRNSQSKDGLHSYCKKCRSKIHKEYLKNPVIHERVLTSIKKWQKGIGKEKYKSYQREYQKSEKYVLRRRQKVDAKPRIFKCKPTIFPDAK